MNHRKALELILWCAKRRGVVDFHTVLKVLFAAEIEHLNKWGRPIVGDTFQAMQNGPVALGTYELMKQEPLALEALGDPSPPFGRTGYNLAAHRDPDMSVFSESEIDALEVGFRKYGTLTYPQRIALSHEHPAWARAWDSGRAYMDYGDFLEGENDTIEARQDLEEVGMALKL